MFKNVPTMIFFMIGESVYIKVPKSLLDEGKKGIRLLQIAGLGVAADRICINLSRPKKRIRPQKFVVPVENTPLIPEGTAVRVSLPGTALGPQVYPKRVGIVRKKKGKLLVESFRVVDARRDAEGE